MDNEEQVKEALKTKEALGALLASEGWAILREMFESRLKSITMEVMDTPIGDGNSIYRQEFRKGEAYTTKWLLALPNGLHEMQAEILSAIPQSEEDDD